MAGFEKYGISFFHGIRPLHVFVSALVYVPTRGVYNE